MRTDLLVRRTRKHFPLLDVGEIKIAPIQKGGSDRKFYRIRCSPDQALILVKYNLEREENRHYVTIANFLTEHRIRVPEIYFHDADEGLIWLEDLGERDLYSYRDETWLVRRAFYESALDQIAALHALPESDCIEMKQHLPAEFNSELYLWEQNYFFENCLGRLLQNRERKARAAGVPTRAAGNRRSPCIVPESPGAPRFSIAEHHHPKRSGAPDRFPGNATWSCRIRSRVAPL